MRVGIIVIVCLSDRFRERSWFAALAMVISITCFMILIASSNNNLRHGFLRVTLIGAGTAIAPIVASLIDNKPDKATRAIFMRV